MQTQEGMKEGGQDLDLHSCQGRQEHTAGEGASNPLGLQLELWEGHHFPGYADEGEAGCIGWWEDVLVQRIHPAAA